MSLNEKMASLMYLYKEKSKAIVIFYLVSNQQPLITDLQPVKLDGLAVDKNYIIQEISLFPNSFTSINAGHIYSGDFIENGLKSSV